MARTSSRGTIRVGSPIDGSSSSALTSTAAMTSLTEIAPAEGGEGFATSVCSPLPPRGALACV